MFSFLDAQLAKSLVTSLESQEQIAVLRKHNLLSSYCYSMLLWKNRLPFFQYALSKSAKTAIGIVTKGPINRNNAYTLLNVAIEIFSDFFRR